MSLDPVPCPGGDSTCPCHDGEKCHYRADDDTRAMAIPPAKVITDALRLLAPKHEVDRIWGRMTKAAFLEAHGDRRSYEVTHELGGQDGNGWAADPDDIAALVLQKLAEAGYEVTVRPGVDQTLFGDNGNCLQAAVASLLQLDLDEVPDIAAAPDWELRLGDFAAKHGFQIRYVFPPDRCPDFGLAYGRSARDIMHAVVVRRGMMSWDPHPHRTGLVSIERYVEFARVP